MTLEYLPIRKEKIRYRPDNMRITLGGKTLQFITSWNNVGEYFAFNIYTKNGDPIIKGRRIVYRVDMFENIVDDRLPDLQVIPADPTGQHDQITFDNFMDEVKPYIFGGDE